MMSLDKGIEHKKEHRKEYHGTKAIDKSCRNHGSCLRCKANRKYKYQKKQEGMDEQYKEYIRGDPGEECGEDY